MPVLIVVSAEISINQEVSLCQQEKTVGGGFVQCSLAGCSAFGSIPIRSGLTVLVLISFSLLQYGRIGFFTCCTRNSIDSRAEPNQLLLSRHGLTLWKMYRTLFVFTGIPQVLSFLPRFRPLDQVPLRAPKSPLLSSRRFQRPMYDFRAAVSV